MVEYFEIGLVSNTHGLKGEIKVRPYTESMKRFEELSKIYIESNNVKTEYEIEKVRYQKDVILLKLKGIDIIEDAEKLKNHIISIPREEGKTLSENEFFIFISKSFADGHLKGFREAGFRLQCTEPPQSFLGKEFIDIRIRLDFGNEIGRYEKKLSPFLIIPSNGARKGSLFML